MKTLLLILSLLFVFSVKSQVSSNPGIPTQASKVTVTFDASSTPLKGYTGELYVHTGVAVDGERWQHVIETWGSNKQPKLKRVSTDLYTLEITPSINEFYKVKSDEKVTELCFVFRSADAKTQTKDIFMKIYEQGLAVAISRPNTQPYFVDAGSNFKLHVDASESESTTVKIDGALKHTETSSPNSFDYTVNVETSGTHTIKVEASAKGKTKSDKFTYTIRSEAEVKALPANVTDGINYIDDNTVTLVLHAPFKKSVYLIGSFNNWQTTAMYKTNSDINDKELRYWYTITGLTKGKEYIFQYLIDENLYLAEPYADKISDPWNDNKISNETYPDLIKYPDTKIEGNASVFQTAQKAYDWKIKDFKPAKQSDLVIYELLVRDFAEKANYQTLIDTIPYFKRLGINAIELMPINEFEGNNSWGYNPAFYFAPDKAYGTKDKLKEFIDVCHTNGIAIIIDMVLNHSFGQSPFVRMYFDEDKKQPTAQNLWYNQESPNSVYSWGYDFNHESKYTQKLVDRINKYWLTEYNVDGFRFDFTKGFTNTKGDGGAYDKSRIAILKRMYDQIIKVKADAYVICEHLSDNAEEKELAAHGLMLWGNMHWQYTAAAEGNNQGDKSDLSGTYYKVRDWNKAKLVAYMESHDEERMMFEILKNGRGTSYYNTKEKPTALKRVELAAAFFFTIPGPKMIWQFGELGYDISIDDPERLAPKPIKWNYYQEKERLHLFQVFAALIKLKKEQDVFENGTVKLIVKGKAKSINISSSSMDVTIIGNFDVQNVQIVPNFQKTGTWYDYFTGKSIEIDNIDEQITLTPGEYHIYTSKKLETPDIIDLKTGIIDISKQSNIALKVYPNPVVNTLNLEFELEKSIEKADISIINIKGQKVRQLYAGALSKGTNKFDWQLSDNININNGTYILQIQSNRLIISKLIVFER